MSKSIAAVIALHLLLSLAYVVRVPLRYAPDEGAHWDYVRYLVEKKSLPRFGPGTTYEAHQPPLYYLVCALPYAITKGWGIDVRFREGDPRSVTGEWAQFGGIAQEDITVVTCRLVSVVFGAANLLFIWLSAREMFPHDTDLLLKTTLLCALLPLNLYVNSAAGNDGAAGFASTLTIWSLLRNGQSHIDIRRACLTGVLAGIAVLFKMNAVFLIVVSAVATYMKVNRVTNDPVKAFRMSGICILTALIVCGGWLMRNSILYGDPFALRAFKEFFHNPSPPDMMDTLGLSFGAYILRVAALTWTTFWGLFGDVNSAIRRMGLFAPGGPGAAFYFLSAPFVVLSIVCLYGWFDRIKERNREVRSMFRPESVVLFLSVLLVILEFVQFNLNYFQAQARYLHMALLPLAIAWAIGVERLKRNLARAAWISLFASLLVVVALDLTIWQPVLIVQSRDGRAAVISIK